MHHLVRHEGQSNGCYEGLAVLGGEQINDVCQLGGQLKPEPPVVFVVCAQKFIHAGQVIPSVLGSQQAKEVSQVFQHPNANLIQVLDESIEDWHQVTLSNLLPQDDGQLVDAEG